MCLLLDLGFRDTHGTQRSLGYIAVLRCDLMYNSAVVLMCWLLSCNYSYSKIQFVLPFLWSSRQTLCGTAVPRACLRCQLHTRLKRSEVSVTQDWEERRIEPRIHMHLQDYPSSAPRIRFVSQMFHPNVRPSMLPTTHDTLNWHDRIGYCTARVPHWY